MGTRYNNPAKYLAPVFSHKQLFEMFEEFKKELDVGKYLNTQKVIREAIEMELTVRPSLCRSP